MVRQKIAPTVEAMLAHLLDEQDLEEPQRCIDVVSSGRVSIRRPN
jgi:hypothetical protein